jgi:N-acyl-D-amino-acid deacylase
MSEDDVRKVLSLPWVSFCSDAESLAPEGIFLKTDPHPRAYGAFARVLGTYVRDERILPLEEAIRRMTSLPAENLRLEGRGRLREGAYADVVVFDPLEVRDHATPDSPHRYSTGVRHVLVNGTRVISEGEHTGARPGRFVRGPGVSAS